MEPGALFSWKGLVPDSIYNGSMAHYIYFTSLLGKGPEGANIASNAYNYLYSNTVLAATKYDPHTVTKNHSSVTIDTVFTFLDKIIANEQSKEMAFLQWMTSKKNEGLDITLPDLYSNWSDFIKEFNKNVQDGQDAISRLEIERKRLEYNINTMRQKNEAKLLSGEYTAEDFEQAQKGYIRSANLNTATQLSKVVDFLSGNHRAKTGEKVLQYILTRIGPHLIDWQTSGIALNKQQLAGLLIGISHMILDEYNTIVNELKLDDLAKGQKNNYAVTRDLESILEGNEHINALFDNLITANNLPMIANKFVQEYAVDLSNTNKSANFQAAIKNYAKNTEKKMSEEAKASELAKDLSKLYSRQVVSERSLEKAFHVTQNKSALSEIKDAMIGIFNGAIHSHRVGQAQGRADVILGYLSIDPNLLTSETELNAYATAAQEISDALNALEDKFSGLNTVEYYEKQEKNWATAMKKIDKAIAKFKKIYNGLADCFVIEDSTKYYDSFRVTKNIQGDMTWEAFQGGSLGSNLESQLSKINALYTAGGLSTFDAEWLLDVCINAGPGMIGEGNKNNLENYFSAIAAILLFDNQLGLAREIVQNIPSSGTSVKQLHVFSINGGYYPLSFLLKATRDHLTEVYQAANSELSNGTYGVRATLSGFAHHPPKFDPKFNPMTPDSWQDVYQKGISSTKLEITFLAGFLDLLNAMFNPK